MSVHLVGGGRTAAAAPAVYGSFLAEAAMLARARGRAVPQIAVLAVGPDTDAANAGAAELAGLLQLAGRASTTAVAVAAGERFPAELPEGMDAVAVGGGVTPAYLRAVEPIRDLLRRYVGHAVPYLGYSAGAMIAARRAIVGGWLLGELPVTAAENGEGLDQLSVEDGLGLVPVAVDVHAAQAGTLTRLICAVRSGLVGRGAAIDEDTVLIMKRDGGAVAGAGQVWSVAAGGAGSVELRVLGPGTSLALTPG